MFEMCGVDCFYGQAQVLRSFSLAAGKGEILCLLGRNGAGKTTALKAIMGLVPARGGSIVLDGTELSSLPAHEVPRHGVGYVPQGRRLFSELTVMENLRVGLMTRNSGPEVLEHVLSLFPLLKDRLTQRAGTMSGGEQQMLAMARALCIAPKLLLLDEPTEGLMPAMIARIRQSVLDLKEHGVTTLLVEQRVDAVLPVADRVAFVENGRVTGLESAADLAKDRALIDRYVGI
ncbi:MAG: ABC transporter ATP-binding protein [Aestuariivirga sp.]|uniref:ABC transporter ATP-binding protein n=1 Tax=Aestuariivirga sp. TaxID=2650926 RepID=UPI0025BEB551|nr:ABC transporter ATP-binding protein [Aestuariivirga sp.]MCA3561545.1 ABC transporter ATP-binding protein [Aestuariivirga sp.]